MSTCVRGNPLSYSTDCRRSRAQVHTTPLTQFSFATQAVQLEGIKASRLYSYTTAQTLCANLHLSQQKQPRIKSQESICARPRLSQSMARGITKAGVATEMVDLLSVDTQELVEIIGRNAGVALLAPPSDSQEAQNAVATVLSAVKAKKQKVRAWHGLRA